MAAEAPSAAEAASTLPRMPLVAAKSRAAGLWAPHEGKYTSAGRRWETDGRPDSLAPSSSGRWGRSPCFPFLGSTRQRKPWQPRAHASGCAAWCGRHHTGKPARGPRNGPQSRRTRGNSRQYLQQGPGAAYEGQPGRKQHPSEDQELWKAGQTTRLQLRVVRPIEDGLGWIHPAQKQ